MPQVLLGLVQVEQQVPRVPLAQEYLVPQVPQVLLGLVLMEQQAQQELVQPEQQELVLLV